MDSEMDVTQITGELDTVVDLESANLAEVEKTVEGGSPTSKKQPERQREIHNMVERMRRYRISTCIAVIADRLPNIGQEKVDKSSVLETALKYLKFLREKVENIDEIDAIYMERFGSEETGLPRKSRKKRSSAQTAPRRKKMTSATQTVDYELPDLDLIDGLTDLVNQDLDNQDL